MKEKVMEAKMYRREEKGKRGQHRRHRESEEEENGRRAEGKKVNVMEEGI